MRKLLIVGCGYVGVATADLFHQNGWAVDGWTASAASAQELANKPYRVRALDVTDLAAVKREQDDYDAMIQCVSSRGGDANDYRKIYLGGARNLSIVFDKALLLFTSSTSVYAQRDGEWVSELSPSDPERETARVLRETEDLVLGARGVIARLGGIYGPGRSALLRKLLAGTAAINPEEPRYLNQVHRDDVASALFLLVAQNLDHTTTPPAPAIGIFNVTDNRPLTERECYEWLASHLARAVPPTGKTGAERKRGNTNKRVSSEKLLALNWSPRFPDFRAGMRESVLPNLAKYGG